MMTTLPSLLNIEEVAAIQHSVGSPFYCFHPDRFRSNVKRIVDVFSSQYNPVVAAYSFKTNYLPALCALARRCGAWAEVVSRLEFDLAVRTGFSAEHIVWNGPTKTYEDVCTGLDSGSLINVDGLQELESVIRYAGERATTKVGIGLRLRVSESSRFGLSKKDAATATELIQQAPISVVALHAHSSSDRSVAAIEERVKLLCDTRSELDLQEVRYIDVGGGFFGAVPSSIIEGPLPSFDEYASAVAGVLDSDEWIAQNKPTVIIEPGVSVAADSLSFVTRVVDLKHGGDRGVAVVDGSAYHIKPTLHRHNLPCRVVGPEEDRSPDRPSRYDVVGSTCMERDLLLKDVELPALRIGDAIQIDQAGAYTIVLSPPFINPPPPVVRWAEDGFRVLRHPVPFGSFFSAYSFES